MNFGKRREVSSTTCQGRKTSFTFCTDVMVLRKCQKYRRERRCSKDGWPKHKNEGKRPIHSKLWPKPLWLSMVLDWGLPAQISRNLEKILSIVNFLCQTQVFLLDGSHPPRDPFIWLLFSGETQNFQIFHETLHMLIHFQEILWSFGPPESQKTSKKWLSATFLTHRKQSWEIAILEGKWQPNSEIPVGLESRLKDLSIKPTLASFGHLKVPQKFSQRRATRQANCSGFQPTAQQNAVLTVFDFLELIFILLIVNDVILWHFYTYVSLLEDSFMR